jgi:hypothetical protein
MPSPFLRLLNGNSQIGMVVSLRDADRFLSRYRSGNIEIAIVLGNQFRYASMP